MASTWSALKIELLETGANAGSWGTLTNANLGDAVLGEAITGQATVDFSSDADVTITLTDSATTQAARNLRLNITESSTGIGSVRNLILGSGCQIEKFYLINNTGTGAKTVKNTSGTGISVPAGKATLVFNNGTNVVDAASYFSSLTLGAALPVASGGTGLTSFTSGGVVYASSSSALATGSALTFDGTNLGVGSGAAINFGGSLVLYGDSTLTALRGRATNGIVFQDSSATEQMRLTSTGLGIGVTPSAWNASFYKVLQVSDRGSSFASNTSSYSTAPYLFIGNNAFSDVASGAGFKYVTTNASAQYRQVNAEHQFFTAASGTAGNAITFTQDMTLATAGLSIGTSTVNYGLTVQKDNGSGYIAAFRSSAGNPYITFQTTGSITQIQGINSAFTDVNNIAMQISGGNVGIGTNSPATKLQVNNSANSGNTISVTGLTTATGAADIVITRTGTESATQGLSPCITIGNTTANRYSSIASYQGGFQFFGFDGSSWNERMRLDSAGNLGLGVTPSAWGSNYKAIQIGGQGSLHTYVGVSMAMSANAYDSGAGVWKYIGNNYACRFVQDPSNGQSVWQNAALGTTNATLTWTSVMTLDASGNLGIGTSSPSNKLEVKGGNGNQLTLDNAGEAYTQMTFKSNGTNRAAIWATAAELGLYTYSTQPIIFYTNTTERARIDDSGNIHVGTTTRRNNATLTISYSGTTNNGIAFIDTANSSGTEFLAFQNSSATNIGTVARVGTTNAVVYNTTSDYRLKTVTGAVTGQGSRIDALKPIDYLWTEGGQQARGFLAHEFQTVYPNSVTGDKDALDANGNPKYQSMQAATSEVIADLVAEIQSLRQRLSAANL